MQPLVIVVSRDLRRIRRVYMPGELGISIFISDAVVLGGDDSLFLGIDGPVTINLGRDGVLTLYNHILDYHLWLSGRLYVSINGRRLRPSRLVVVGRLIADVTLEHAFYGVGILKPEDAVWVEKLVAKASRIAVQPTRQPSP
jgi:hypothetical protein